MSNYNTTYGGAMPYSMTAPRAPAGASQGAAMAGGQMLPAALTQKAQQTMGVPTTAVKGLLKRAKPKVPPMPMQRRTLSDKGPDSGYV